MSVRRGAGVRLRRSPPVTFSRSDARHGSGLPPFHSGVPRATDPGACRLLALRSIARRLIPGIAALAVVALSVAAAWPQAAAASPEATRTEKIRLLDKAAQAPQLLVLGSSRAMRVDPILLGRLTGLRGFNAAVSSGTCADTWCLLHLVADRFPAAPTPRVLWVLDVEQFRARGIHPWLLSVPRLTQYIPAQFLSAAGSPSSAGTSAADGLVVVPPPARPATQAAAGYGYRRVYAANGFLRWAPDDFKAAHGWTLADGIADSVQKYRGIYPRGFKAVGGMPSWFVRESIALLNREGVRPVIVLSPYQPQLLSFIVGRGWPRRHQQVLDFFASLRPSCDFVLLDMTRLSSFVGRPAQFYDGTHGRVALLNGLVRAVVRRAGSALTAPAQ
jgi:hypothetical protein